MTPSAWGAAASLAAMFCKQTGLNRVVLNAGRHQFATILASQMEECGGQVVTVPARSKSQTCAACGVIDVPARESQASFHFIGIF